MPRTVTDFFFLIKDKGNIAVHENKGTIDDAKHCLFSAFKLSIARRVEQLFVLADKIKAAYQQLKQKTDALASATLAKAFKGGLVEQDANDEPGK